MTKLLSHHDRLRRVHRCTGRRITPNSGPCAHMKCHVKSSASENHGMQETKARKLSWSWLTTPSDGRWAAANGRRRTAEKTMLSRHARVLTASMRRWSEQATLPGANCAGARPEDLAPGKFCTQHARRGKAAHGLRGAPATAGPWPAPASRHPMHALSSASRRQQQPRPTRAPCFLSPRAKRTPAATWPKAVHARALRMRVSDRHRGESPASAYRQPRA